MGAQERLRPTIGDPELDGALFIDGEPLIIYGEPGSGKTNIVLKIIKESIGRGLTAYYISTEGSIVYNRMTSMGLLELKGLYIAIAHSLSHLSKLVSQAIAEHSGIIAIDSINSLYRAEVGFNQRANEIFLGVLALLRLHTSLGGWAIATAQVRGEDEDMVPSGIDLISFYCRKTARVTRTGLRERIIEAGGKRHYFRISENDIELIKDI